MNGELAPQTTSTPAEPTSEQMVDASKRIVGNQVATDAESRKEEMAWEKYVPFGSQEYYRINESRIAILDYRYGSNGQDAEIIASINVDKNGEAISGHEHSPEARSLKDIEAAYGDYLARTPAERHLVITEGSYQPGRFTSKEEGVKIRSESGMLQFMAERDNIPVESGEPSNEDIADALEKQGINRSELASLYAVWGISSFIRQEGNSPNDLGAHIYHSAATAGLEGFHVYSEEEKKAIIAGGGQEEVMTEIGAKAGTLVETINKLAVEELHGAELLRIEDGKVKLNLDPKIQDHEAIDQALLAIWTPESKSKLGAITRAVNLYRDRHLFHKIVQASREDKSPFVVYGGSHVVCLEPALQSYFS